MQGQESRLGFSGLILSLLPLSCSPQPALAPGILASPFALPSHHTLDCECELPFKSFKVMGLVASIIMLEAVLCRD